MYIEYFILERVLFEGWYVCLIHVHVHVTYTCILSILYWKGSYLKDDVYTCTCTCMNGMTVDFVIQALLKPELETVVDTLHSDIVLVRELLSSLVSHPPILPNTPPTSTRLLWLQAVRQRVDIPMERIRFSAAYLLQGEKGFTLRHTYAEVIREIDESVIMYMYMYKCTHTLHVYVNSTCLSLDIFTVYEQKCTCTHSVMTCTYMYMYVGY